MDAAAYTRDMHPLSLKIVPPFQVLILGGLMWLIHRFLPVLHFHTGYDFLISRILLFACLGVFAASVYQFWRARTTVDPRKIDQASALITKGVYRWSRNPIYVADVLLLLAWAVWLGAWINLLLVVVFILYVTRFQIEPEEAALTEKFGADYQRYCRSTRRWI